MDRKGFEPLCKIIAAPFQEEILKPGSDIYPESPSVLDSVGTKKIEIIPRDLGNYMPIRGLEPLFYVYKTDTLPIELNQLNP